MPLDIAVIGTGHVGLITAGTPGRPVDDPERRCPDISLAREVLGWAPAVTLDQGLDRTIEWCRRSGWAGEDDAPIAEPATPGGQGQEFGQAHP
jgi:hypothetical protein